jgi:hypothetical protein
MKLGRMRYRYYDTDYSDTIVVTHVNIRNGRTWNIIVSGINGGIHFQKPSSEIITTSREIVKSKVIPFRKLK